MNEFSLIDTYFKNISPADENIVVGIGDDAACLSIPVDMELLISTDTLVEGIHFMKEWSPADIAYRSLAVNVSDIVAMGAEPKWVTLALTLPTMEHTWLQQFSHGFRDTLQQFQIALIGGDVTKGSLVITIGIYGLVKKGKAVKRSKAKEGDGIFVTGELGGAAFAVDALTGQSHINDGYMKKLLHPQPRLDFIPILQQFASAAIDISDGLEADLHHILDASGVGAFIALEKMPLYQDSALHFALNGGDDYELCFTVPQNNIHDMLNLVAKKHLQCTNIGVVTQEKGLRAKYLDGQIVLLEGKGYVHF